MLSRLNSLKVGARIYIGFGVVLALLSVVAYVGYSGLHGASENFGDYRDLARMRNQLNRTALAAQSLNTRLYIDVTFDPRGESPIDPTSIDGHEFTLAGTGLADVALDGNNFPILVGSPLFITGTTWRYYLKDKDTTNTTGLFKPGEVQVTFVNPTTSSPIRSRKKV